jgi:predicted secreted protein
MAQTGGFGCIVRINITATLTVIADVVELKFPEFERTVADITAHDSTNGWAEYIATGMRKMSEFTMTVVWDDGATTHAALLTNFNSATSVNMNIQDPLGQEVIAFAAFITKIARSGEMDDAFKAEITVQPTGAPTIT